MKKQKKWLVLAGLLVLAGVFCGGIAVNSYLEEKHAGREYEELRENVVSTPEPTPEPATEPVETVTEEVTPEAELVEIPIDFAKLQEKYPDIYAWIQIPGTNIDYPIVQREGDNGYYLNHTIAGKEKPEGAIFTEDYNQKDFTDPNTVIYGHNMKNGSMFRDLHEYRDRKFFKDHQELVVYLPDQVLHYQIFAAYVYDNRHLLQSFSFDNEEIFESYLRSVFGKKDMDSMIDDSVAVTGEDKIITLSTCNGNSDQRYLVQAVLLSIEQGKQK
ncbi:MAG: class B sortase [Erysipelotrichaceae bacterium]|nr:class B sortase [Erysipelotrichaceae bacterium]